MNTLAMYGCSNAIVVTFMERGALPAKSIDILFFTHMQQLQTH